MEITTEFKHQIKEALGRYVQQKGSANAAANSLIKVSPATISQVMNNNWDLISEDMWRRIANGIGFSKQEWKIAETSVYMKIRTYFNDAKINPSGIRALVVHASMGKSVAVNSYCQQEANSYYIRCHRHMGVRHLLRDMLKSMGKDNSGTSIEMIENLVNYLEREPNPLFIIDEVDKLKDEVLEIFIDLENKLHRKCGFVFLGTEYLKKRIEAGVSRNKRGFAELYSRMKKIFWNLNPVKKEFINDVQLICHANGVSEELVITEFTNKCDNDFRVLQDLITAFKNR